MDSPELTFVQSQLHCAKHNQNFPSKTEPVTSFVAAMHGILYVLLLLLQCMVYVLLLLLQCIRVECEIFF